MENSFQAEITLVHPEGCVPHYQCKVFLSQRYDTQIIGTAYESGYMAAVKTILGMQEGIADFGVWVIDPTFMVNGVPARYYFDVTSDEPLDDPWAADNDERGGDNWKRAMQVLYDATLRKREGIMEQVNELSEATTQMENVLA